MYADYTFYTTVYMGTAPEDEYDRLHPRAAAEIDRMTMGRAAGAPGTMQEAVKMAECAVLDELVSQAQGGSGDVVSESNDGISVSYASGAVAKSSRQRIIAAADTWLYGTSLCAVPI